MNTTFEPGDLVVVIKPCFDEIGKIFKKGTILLIKDVNYPYNRPTSCSEPEIIAFNVIELSTHEHNEISFHYIRPFVDYFSCLK